LALLTNLLGVLMLGLAVAMGPAALLSHIDGTQDFSGHMWAMMLTATIGAVLFLMTYRSSRDIHVGHREGFLIVGIGWFAAGLIGAMPYYLYAHLAPAGLCVLGASPMVGSDFCSFTNAAFESISGFTTTGASIITDGLWGEPGLTPDGRPGLPRGILLWRSITHFLGGMGIIVLGVAVLPLLGVGGMQLFKAEVPGPQAGKIAPRIAETAKLLWVLYLLLCCVLFVLLLVGGMNAFEAICHSFSTIATGGFSTRAASVSGFSDPFIEWTIIFFMLIAGTNFALHFAALRGKPRVYLRDPEWWTYVGLVMAATVAVGFAIGYAIPDMGIEQAARQSAFQVLSVMTGTGFASTDYEQWTSVPLAIIILIGLMFVGGMSGSTTGGFKVVRHLLIFRMWIRDLFFLSHPHGVRPIRLGSRVVSSDVLRSVSAFAGAYVTLMVTGALIFCLDGQDAITGFTASASSLGNVGAGLGAVGPMDNYSVLSPFSKWVSAVLMILGRLELFTLLVLLSPSFWRR
jgi:trk system potassium uptake protein